MIPSRLKIRAGAPAAIIALGLVCGSAGELRAQSEKICGSDASILTPFSPIIDSVTGPRLGATPDVTFDFEGQPPCSFNPCRVLVRDGHSRRTLATIQIPSDDVTYCRSADPFRQLSPLTTHKVPGDCFGGIYFASRSVLVRGSPPKAGVLIDWFDHKGTSKPFDCFGPSAGDWHVFRDRIRRIRTKSNAMLRLGEIFNEERERQDAPFFTSGLSK